MPLGVRPRQKGHTLLSSVHSRKNQSCSNNMFNMFVRNVPRHTSPNFVQKLQCRQSRAFERGSHMRGLYSWTIPRPKGRTTMQRLPCGATSFEYHQRYKFDHMRGVPSRHSHARHWCCQMRGLHSWAIPRPKGRTTMQRLPCGPTPIKYHQRNEFDQMRGLPNWPSHALHRCGQLY